MKKIIPILGLMMVLPLAAVLAHGGETEDSIQTAASDEVMMETQLNHDEMEQLMKTMMTVVTLSEEEADRMINLMNESMPMMNGTSNMMDMMPMMMGNMQDGSSGAMDGSMNDSSGMMNGMMGGSMHDNSTVNNNNILMGSMMALSFLTLLVWLVVGVFLSIWLYKKLKNNDMSRSN